MKRRKENLGNYMLVSLKSAYENHGMNTPERDTNAHERYGGDLRQSAWLHEGQIMPNQSGGFL